MENRTPSLTDLLNLDLARPASEIILLCGGEAALNPAFTAHLPGWNGQPPAFSWENGPQPESGCARGTMTVDWADADGTPRRLIADGCLLELALPDGATARLAAFGYDSYQVLLCVACAFCVHVLRTRPQLAAWAQGAIDAVPLGVGIKDEDLCYTGGNPAFSALADGADYIGMTDYELRWRDRAPAIRSGNARSLVASAPELGRYFTIYGKNGAMSWLRANSMAAVTPDGRFIALVTLIEDVTSRVETGDSLLYSALQNKRVQQDIIDQSRAVALILARTARAEIRFVTDSIRQYGYDAGELCAAATSFSGLVCEDAREAFVRFVDDIARPGGEYTHTAPIGDASGKRRIVQMHLRCLEREDGPVLAGVMVDISRRARLQQRLMEESRSIEERISRILGRDPGLLDSGMAVGKLIDAKRLQRHQDTLAGIFELSAVAVDTYAAPLTSPSFSNPLLTFLMKNRAAGERLSKELDALSAEAGRLGAPARKTLAQTGLHVAAVPFMHAGRHIATWIVGHVRTEPPDEARFTQSCRDLGVDLRRALKLYRAQYEMGEREFGQALAEFSRVADMVAMQCVRTEHLMSQAEAGRQATQKILHSLAQQRLINKCYNLARSAQDLSGAIDEILACAGEDLGFSRAYLMESRSSGLLSITHEWLDENINPVPWEHRVLLQSEGEPWAYAEPGLKIIDMRTSAESPRYVATGTKSSVHMPIFSSEGLEGAIVFEECAHTRIYFQQDREYLDVLMRLISSIVLRRNAEREISRSHAAIDTVMLNLDMAVFTYDPETFRVLYVNDYCVRNLGISRESPGYAFDIFPEIKPGSLCLSDGHAVELTRRDRVFLVTHDRVPWQNGRDVELVSAADITLNRDREHLIERLAYCDPLLDIPNRRKFERDLDAALAQSPEGGLVFMDLDDFKLINDSLGHNRGDMLLKAIAAFFQNFGPTKDRLYRLGGDEFMLILDGFGPERISDTVESVWDRFQKPWEIDGLSVFTTVSIGVSRFAEDARTAGELMRYADVAMYKAKYEGKNSAVFFRKGLEGGVTQRMNTENRLRAAIRGGFEGFEVHYQPIVELGSSKIAGAEALLRWRDDEGRLIYPDAFIAIAESLGLMSALGEFVLETALRDMKTYCAPGFLIVVNLSLRQFQGGSLTEAVAQALGRAQIPPGCLVLGVSEAAAAFDMQSGDNTLGKLRNLGAHVSLDNKGTSYNALSKVVRSNIDFVNIDISLIGSMQHDAFSDTVVQASIELAKSAGCRVFCAGVEVQEQFLDLKEYGCDFAQGFFFSRAMPLEDFDAFLLRKRAETGRRRRVTAF